MDKFPYLLFFYSSYLTNNIICRIVCTERYYTAYNIMTRKVFHNYVKQSIEITFALKNRRIGGQMVFNTGAALLDAIVLAVVSKEPEGTYGYKITQDVRQVIELSESTLYPVLRRLQKDECLEVYDMECAGRNRRYYKVTSRGWAQLKLYESEWRSYSEKINSLFA